MAKAKPFIKWVGGKTQLIEQLDGSLSTRRRILAGRSLLNPPHTIFVIMKKLSLADTRIVYVSRMLETTMLRVIVPPMSGNNATAQTHLAFIFNIGMGNQKFAEFNRCNPIHRK